MPFGQVRRAFQPHSLKIDYRNDLNAHNLFVFGCRLYSIRLHTHRARIVFVFSCPQKCVRKDEVDSKALDQKKTLQSSNVSKAANENDEFEKQRIAAIAEVAKSKEVCVWRGGYQKNDP